MRSRKFTRDVAAKELKEAYDLGRCEGSTASLKQPWSLESFAYGFDDWGAALVGVHNRGFRDGQAQRRRDLERVCGELNQDTPPPRTESPQ